MPPTDLPDAFVREPAALEESYLQQSDPIAQSGFSGEPERWRAERQPILEAVTADGDFLDAGCANGYLLECLVRWERERGVALIPHGLDQGARLISLAQQRHHRHAANFFVGNAWDWEPARRFRCVSTLVVQVPSQYVASYLDRLFARVVAPGGRLIAGDYGSRSRGVAARDVAAMLRSAGLSVSGETAGGQNGVARFAWAERQH